VLLELAKARGVIDGEEYWAGDLIVDPQLIDTIELEDGPYGEPVAARLKLVSDLRVGRAGAAALYQHQNQLEEGEADERPRKRGGRSGKKVRRLLRELLAALHDVKGNGEVVGAGDGHGHE